MNIVNLTPHSINIYNENKEMVLTVPPSGQIARVGTAKNLVDTVDSIPMFETVVTGEPAGLPERQENTIFIVSGIFRSNFDREDLYQPGELLRNEAGQPIGCIGLSR